MKGSWDPDGNPVQGGPPSRQAVRARMVPGCGSGLGPRMGAQKFALAQEVRHPLHLL